MGLQSTTHHSRLLTEFVEVDYRDARPGRTADLYKCVRMLLSTSGNTTSLDDLIVPCVACKRAFRSSRLIDLKYVAIIEIVKC